MAGGEGVGRVARHRGTRAGTDEFFIDDLLVRIHFIIVMIRWTGLAPWEFEFPFQGSLTSAFLGEQVAPRCPAGHRAARAGMSCTLEASCRSPI